MNVAFPALLLFFIVLPGFIFFYTFKQTEKTVLDFSPFAASTIKSIVIAAVLQTIGVALVFLCTAYQFQPQYFLMLLIGGTNTSGLRVADAVQNLSNHAVGITGYFAALYLFAGISGFALRQLITKRKWDVSDSIFGDMLRFDTPWYYLFNGNRDDSVAGVVIAAIVDLKDGSFLFTGILSRYFLDDTGQLDRLILVNTQRRSVRADRTDSAAEPDRIPLSPTLDDLDLTERFYGIQGDYFVMRYHEIITLNIRYLYEEIL